MESVNCVYVAQLTGMLVLGPEGESFGRVRDVVLSSIVRRQPPVRGLVVVGLATRLTTTSRRSTSCPWSVRVFVPVQQA